MKVKLKVTLISHTPDCERLVAAAARLCYTNSSVDALYENTDPDSMIRSLISMGHESPLEHCSFTFGIEGVSRALLAQLTRHRIASYSVKSQRYVDESSLDYIVPPEIALDPKAEQIFEETVDYLRQQYIKLRDILKENHINKGTDAKEAGKLAIEDARFILPNACETKLIMTMNARSLFNFFNLRSCERAQWEIRALANEMLELVRQVAPTIFEKAGAPCVSGPCPEGAKSCGRPKR